MAPRNESPCELGVALICMPRHCRQIKVGDRLDRRLRITFVVVDELADMMNEVIRRSKPALLSPVEY